MTKTESSNGKWKVIPFSTSHGDDDHACSSLIFLSKSFNQFAFVYIKPELDRHPRRTFVHWQQPRARSAIRVVGLQIAVGLLFSKKRPLRAALTLILEAFLTFYFGRSTKKRTRLYLDFQAMAGDSHFQGWMNSVTRQYGTNRVVVLLFVHYHNYWWFRWLAIDWRPLAWLGTSDEASTLVCDVCNGSKAITLAGVDSKTSRVTTTWTTTPKKTKTTWPEPRASSSATVGYTQFATFLGIFSL